jgi:hypothetical protein
MLIKNAAISKPQKVALSGAVGILAGIGLGAFLASKHEDAKGLLGLITGFAEKDSGKAVLGVLGGTLAAKLAMEPKNVS